MTSENIITSLFAQAKEDLAAYEKVAVILYAAMQEGESSEIPISQIKDLARKGRTGVNERSISGLLRHLNTKGWVDKSKSGYYLTLNGEEKIEASLLTLRPKTTTRNNDFLNIHGIEDDFYAPLISDINRCYRAGVNDPVLILFRKLIENVLIDVLRGHYGKQNINLFYVPSQGRFQSFSTLLKNVKAKKRNFKMYYLDIDNLIDEIDEFRERGNSSAHSIEVKVPDKRLEKLSPRATELAKILLRIKRQVEAGSNQRP